MARWLGIGVMGLAVAAAGAWAMPGMGHRMGGPGESAGCAMQSEMRGQAGMHGGARSMAAMHGGGMAHGMGMHGRGGAQAQGGPSHEGSAGSCPMHDGGGHAGCPMHDGSKATPAKP